VNEKWKGVSYMAACAVLWSTAGVLIKLLPWNPMVIAGLRSLIAAGAVGVYFLARRERPVFSRRTLAIALSVSLTFFCFMAANKLTTAANAIVLQYSAPVFLLIYEAAFKKQKFHWMDYLVVALTLGGIALFFLDQLDAGSLLGNIIAIFAGITFAAMFISSGGVTQTVRMSGILQGHLIAAIVGIPMLLFFDTPFTAQSWLVILFLGIFQLGIPYVLYALAAKNCPPLTCTLISALEPLLNPLWVFLFVGEKPGIWALIGGAVVIVSITGWCVWDGKRKGEEVPAG